MVSWKISFLAISVCNLAAIKADACSCLAQPIEKDFALADAVFIGKVTSISEISTGVRSGSLFTSTQEATFEVSQQFKGPLVQVVTFEVIFPVTDGTCGYPFYVGGTYVVWATGDQYGGYKSSNGICGRTFEIDVDTTPYVQDELNWLRTQS